MDKRKDLSSEEFAAYVGKSPATVNRWAPTHPAARWDSFSGTWRWLPEEYDRFIAQSKARHERVRRGPKSRLRTITGGER